MDYLHHHRYPFTSPIQQLLLLGSHRNVDDNNPIITMHDQQQQQPLYYDTSTIQQQYMNMIHEFWNENDDNTSIIWKTLPQRVHTIVNQMIELHKQILVGTNTDTTTTIHNTNNVTFMDLSKVVTAAILVQQPKSNCFLKSWIDYFTASLLYHIIQQQQEQLHNNENTNHNRTSDDESLFLLNIVDDTHDTIHTLFDNKNEEQRLLYHNLRYLGWIQQTQHLSSTTTATATTMKSSSNWFILHEPLLIAIEKIIIKQVRGIIVGNYDTTYTDISTHINTATTTTTSMYQSIIDWTNNMIFPWLHQIVFGIHTEENNQSTITKTTPWTQQQQQWKNVLENMVIQSYWNVRVSEIFDIVTSYPDSLPAVMELKLVLHMLLQSNSCTNQDSNASKNDATNTNKKSELLIQELAQSLRSSFIVRLNHPGANTTQMIDVYIAAIQVVRILLSQNDDNHSSSMITTTTTTTTTTSILSNTNNSNTLIAYITEPVRSYLRNHRNDTVRCILTSLTNSGTNGNNNSSNNNGESSSSNHVLYHELRRQDTKPLEYMNMNSDDEDDDEEECPTMDWQPRPSIYSYTHQQQQQQQRNNHYHRSNSNTGNKKHDSDILAMLVSIYGSKELFVNEYRSMLADKLLNNIEYNTDQDIHTLELLKLRFGEMSLINAEVMIKDIEDSARINKNIRDSYMTKRKSDAKLSDASNDVVVVDAAIVSHIFWPKLQIGSFKHHPRIQVLLDEYATIYADQKNPRSLQWYHHLGSVQLEMDVIEEQLNTSTNTISTLYGTKAFNCSPLLATLISHFEDEPIWTAEQLSNETNVPDHILVKQMSYWITQRVVICTSTTNTGRNSTSTQVSHYDTSKIVYSLASKMDQNRVNRNGTIFPRGSMIDDL
jgi:Cullin family